MVGYENELANTVGGLVVTVLKAAFALNKLCSVNRLSKMLVVKNKFFLAAYDSVVTYCNMVHTGLTGLVGGTSSPSGC